VGAAIAVHCHERRSEAEALMRQLQAQGVAATVIVADLTQADEAGRAVGEVVEALGGLDLLVNNAGVTLGGSSVESTSIEDWLWVTDINLHSVFYLCRAAIPELRARGGGSIVNVASNIVNSLPGGSAAYATTKAAVVALTKVLSKEVGHEGIRVNALSPGLIAAGMGQGAIERRSEAEMVRFLESIPSKRAGSAEEIAGVVRFLCSPAASYLTGQNLTVNGGDRTESYQ
ncbi:MAG: SDR family oxidoreductase, partial [Gemmatimonadetes bacterium]|nr:SDR family oxidoreductase [Gemmatimonadota bacterium]